MLEKSELIKIKNFGTNMPKPPFMRNSGEIDHSGFGWFRNILSGTSVLLSLSLVITIYTVFQNIYLPIVIGVVLLMISFFVEKKKIESLDIFFKLMFETEGMKHSIKNSKTLSLKEKNKKIAIICLLFSLVLAGAGVFSYIGGNNSDKEQTKHELFKLYTDSVSNVYRGRIDSLEVLKTDNNIIEYIKTNNKELYSRVIDIQQSIDIENQTYAKTRDYVKNPIAHNEAIDRLTAYLDKADNNIVIKKNERIKFLNEQIIKNRNESKEKVENYRKEFIVEKNVDIKNVAEYSVYIISLLVEILIAVFAYYTASENYKHKVEEDEFTLFVRGMPQFMEFERWYVTLEKLYSLTPVNSSWKKVIVTAFLNKIHKTGKGSNIYDEFRNMMHILGVIVNTGTTIAINEEEAINNLIELYLTKINSRLEEFE